MVALESSYFKTYQTIPSSNFYIAYCQIYSDYKTFGERWRPSRISPQKSGRKQWKQFVYQNKWKNTIILNLYETEWHNDIH